MEALAFLYVRSMNPVGIVYLLLIGVIAWGGWDLHEKGVLGLAFVSLLCGIVALVLREKRFRLAYSLTAIGLLLIGVQRYYRHYSYDVAQKTLEEGISTTVSKKIRDDAVRRSIVRSQGIESVAGTTALTANNLDIASLRRLGTEYGSQQGKMISSSKSDLVTGFMSHACALVISIEYRLHRLPSPGPTVVEAESYLDNGFYWKRVDRPSWINAVSSVRPLATGEDALPACVAHYSVSEHEKFAR